VAWLVKALALSVWVPGSRLRRVAFLEIFFCIYELFIYAIFWLLQAIRGVHLIICKPLSDEEHGVRG
jgi:hypothetical protein